MRINIKGNRYSFVTIVSVCFFLCAFVLPMPIYAAGKAVAWGYNGYGECNVPSPSTGFSSIAAGGNFSLGLKQDGSIWAWGYNEDDECNVPLPNTGFMAIAASIHSLGLKTDGSIVAWGYNGYGECNVPLLNTGFTAISAGYYHSLGLKQDGSIVAWGRNDYNQCNVPEPNIGFTAIAAGGYYSLGLKHDGSIVAWGRNDSGQCNVPEPNTGFSSIAAGYAHSLGLKQDGSIVAWGRNLEGECTVSEPNTGFTAISAGHYHSLGLKQEGSIAAWGSNVYGQCTAPSFNRGFSSISAGWLHSLGLKLNLAIAKCTVTAGKIQYSDNDGDINDFNEMQDAFTASGTISSVPSDLNSVTHIDVNIISADGNSIFYEANDFNYAHDAKKGKFTHTYKIAKGNPTEGAITSLVIDFNKKTFAVTVKSADLTGLACPLQLIISIGDSVISGETNETIVNGPKTLTPTRLMRTYKDTLVVNKAKTKHNSKKLHSDTLSVTGDIAVTDTDVNLCNADVNFIWGQQSFSVPPGSFKASKTGHLFKCSKVAADANGNTGIVTALVDTDKATFTLSVNGANAIDASSASIPFGISFADFNETIDVNRVTGRSW